MNASAVDEFNRLNRDVVPKPARRIVMGLYVCCALLDIVGLFGLEIAPSTLSRYACSMRPMGVISAPFFSEELIRYGAEQCSGGMSEPLVSIIFLSIKFALGMLVLLLVCGFVAVRPEGLVALYNYLCRRIAIPGGYLHEFKRWGRRFLIVVTFDVVGILLSSRTTVSNFNTSLAHKLFVEDGLSVLNTGDDLRCALIPGHIRLSQG